MSEKAFEIKKNHTTYNLQSWSKQKGLNPIPIEKAEGIYMWDFDGNRYTDMSSQLVNLNVGHGNRQIIDAIKEQAEKYCYLSPAYGSEPRGEQDDYRENARQYGQSFLYKRRSGRKRKCG